jgi:hypothetical protein
MAIPKALVMLCEEKQRLRLCYTQALEDNSRAVDNLLLARGKPDYDRLRVIRDEARHALNIARTALEQHKQEHSC